MTRTKVRSALILLLCASVAQSLWCASAAQVATEKASHAAVTPIPRDIETWWKDRHEGFNKRAQRGGVDLVFIGDSITQGWETEGKTAWEKHYSKRNAMNLGIGGDRTQNVLWRLDNGNVEGISPKLAVVMIGTNNSNNKDHTAEEIADGITAIVERLKTKLPQTKILLLAIFPRGEKPNAQREKIAETNRIVSRLADDKTVFYLDIGPKFLSADGSLSKDIMPDFLHLSPKGYEIWAESVEPKISELMGEHS